MIETLGCRWLDTADGAGGRWRGGPAGAYSGDQGPAASQCSNLEGRPLGAVDHVETAAWANTSGTSNRLTLTACPRPPAARRTSANGHQVFGVRRGHQPAPVRAMGWTSRSVPMATPNSSTLFPGLDQPAAHPGAVGGRHAPVVEQRAARRQAARVHGGVPAGQPRPARRGDGEIICVRTGRPSASTVWRFAHHRKAASHPFWDQAAGQTSSTRRAGFLLFTSNWEGHGRRGAPGTRSSCRLAPPPRAIAACLFNSLTFLFLFLPITYLVLLAPGQQDPAIRSGLAVTGLRLLLFSGITSSAR